MFLIDLPIELLRDLLEQTVFTVGITAAVKLRRVCSTIPTLLWRENSSANGSRIV